MDTGGDREVEGCRVVKEMERQWKEVDGCVKKVWEVTADRDPRRYDAWLGKIGFAREDRRIW